MYIVYLKLYIFIFFLFKSLQTLKLKTKLITKILFENKSKSDIILKIYMLLKSR